MVAWKLIIALLPNVAINVEEVADVPTALDKEKHVVLAAGEEERSDALAAAVVGSAVLVGDVEEDKKITNGEYVYRATEVEHVLLVMEVEQQDAILATGKDTTDVITVMVVEIAAIVADPEK